jgi:DNA-binding NarL/FixJ family response regulator
MKSVSPAECRATIGALLDSEYATCESSLQHHETQGDLSPRPHGSRRAISALTPRELQVLTHIGRGLHSKEIARALRVRVKTVDRHRTNLMAKLDIHDRVQLTLYAIREGLVVPWDRTCWTGERSAGGCARRQR